MGGTPSSHGGGYPGYPPPSRPGQERLEYPGYLPTIKTLMRGTWVPPTIKTWLGYPPPSRPDWGTSLSLGPGQGTPHHQDLARVLPHHQDLARVLPHHQDLARVLPHHPDLVGVSPHHADLFGVPPHHQDLVKVSSIIQT